MSTTNDPPPVLREAPRVQPRAASARQRSTSRKRQTERVERIGIYVLAGAAGLGTALAPAMVVPVEPVAFVLRGLIGFAVTLAGSRARRWTWLVAGGVGVLVSTDPWWLAVAGAAVGVAFVSIFLPRRRVLGALSVGLAVQPLFHMPEVGDAFVSTLIGIVAVAPVLGSAYLVAPRRVRRRVHRVALGAGAFVALAAMLAGLAALLGYGDATRGADAASEGIAKVRSGDSAEATSSLREAEASFGRAEGVFGAPWVWPALAVPGLAQHVDALAVMSREGREVSASAAAVTEQVDYDRLRYEDGRIDTAAVVAAQAPLRDAAGTFTAAQGDVARQRGSLLLGPLAAAVDRFGGELDQAAPQAEVAASTAEVAPGLLGADGPRRYAVLFMTPAELRGLGGFVGSWVILEARDGRVNLVESLRTDDLKEAGDDVRELVVPTDATDDERTRMADYLGRYGRFQPATYIQDVTVSPDLATVGPVVEQLMPQLGQAPVDGVIVADPSGISSLLELTGPVRAEGYDGELDADNVEDFLLTGQYEQFADTGAREDFLGEVGRVTFEQLVQGSLPSPEELGEVIGPAVREGHLGMWSTRDEEQSLLGRVGADAAFPTAGGGDLLSVRSQNKGNNKIDVYLHRDVEQVVRFDPETGAVESKVQVRLRNDAPAEGLSDVVIGNNDQGLPFGTNVSYVSIYTPLALKGARLDGASTGMEFQRELGVSVYSSFVSIPAGGEVVLELDLRGKVDPGTYRLTIAPQATVNRDGYALTIQAPEGWIATGTEATTAFALAPDQPAGARFTGQASPTEVVRVQAGFEKP